MVCGSANVQEGDSPVKASLKKVWGGSHSFRPTFEHIDKVEGLPDLFGGPHFKGCCNTSLKLEQVSAGDAILV